MVPVTAAPSQRAVGVRVPRVPVLLLGMVCLVAAGWGGLWRVGWFGLQVPGALVAAHGAAMVGGFLGAVIGLERAVALGAPWGYAAPLLCGAGGVLLLAGAPGGPVMLLGCTVFAAVNLLLAWRARALFSAAVALGSVLLVAACGRWVAGLPVAQGILAWLAFPILTIVGERLELSRLMPPSRWGTPLLCAALAVLTAGALVEPRWPTAGAALFAAGLVVVPVWAAIHDLARRTMRLPGLPGFVAMCVACGYAWLWVAAGTLWWSQGTRAGPAHDAVVHTITMGLVFSMVFGHAPIIVPALLRVRLPYRPWMYAPLLLLQGSLLARVWGDVDGHAALRRTGGLLNAVAVLAFVVAAVTTVRSSRTRGEELSGVP